MKFMDEFLQQGLVINYDSIGDFRKKLSTQFYFKYVEIT